MGTELKRVEEGRSPWGGEVGGMVGRGCSGWGLGVGYAAYGNLNKLQREKNSVSFCLVSSCHSGRSGSAWVIHGDFILGVQHRPKSGSFADDENIIPT